MRRRKFSREFKLEAARFAQATGVRLGLVAPGIWTARLEDSPGLGSRRMGCAGAVHERYRHLVADGAVRTNLVGGTLTSQASPTLPAREQSRPQRIFLFLQRYTLS
jgi:hypothetical protein